MRLSYLKKNSKSPPDKPGIYRIFWKDGKIPEFTRKTGDRKENPGNDPVSTETLKGKWVEGENLIYIGMTDRTLSERIDELVKYGNNLADNHLGGRYMWQIKYIWDHATIECEECENPKERKKELLQKFKREHNGKLPFANLV